MTIYMGVKTIVDIDRKRGLLTVYDAKTGEVMYQLKTSKDLSCGY